MEFLSFFDYRHDIIIVFHIKVSDYATFSIFCVADTETADNLVMSNSMVVVPEVAIVFDLLEANCWFHSGATAWGLQLKMD